MSSIRVPDVPSSGTGAGSRQRLIDAVRAPEFDLQRLLTLSGAAGLCAQPLPEAERQALQQLLVNVKYQGYVQRQQREVDRLRRGDAQPIPEGFDFMQLKQLSIEARQRLSAARPATLGQAARVPGVTPAALALLSVLMRRGGAASGSGVAAAGADVAASGVSDPAGVRG